MPEQWHWGKPPCLPAAGVIGGPLFSASLQDATASRGSVPAGIGEFPLGLALVSPALAGTAVTRFWTHYEALPGSRKVKVMAAWIPGSVFWAIEIAFMRVLWFVFTVVLGWVAE
jgi:hypothetical protein